MTIPLPWTFSADEPAGPDLEDRLQEVFDKLAQQFPVSVGQVSQVPQVRVHRAAAQAIPTGAVTAVTFDTEDWDTAALHDNVTNPSRLTAASTGLWEIDAHVNWAAAAGGVQRYAAIRVNGATLVAEQVKVNSATLLEQTSVGTQYRLNSADYVELVVFQDSGGNLNASPMFAMHWVSP